MYHTICDGHGEHFLRSETVADVVPDVPATSIREKCAEIGDNVVAQNLVDLHVVQEVVQSPDVQASSSPLRVDRRVNCYGELP